MLRTTGRVAALLISCFTVACAAFTTSLPEPTENTGNPTDTSARGRIIGTWDFSKGCGGITGQCRPAHEIGFPTRYVFQTNDTVVAFSGSAQMYRTNYAVYPGATDSTKGDTRPILLIGFGPAVDPMPLRISFPSPDALIIDQGCCDRYAVEYVRVR
jgi:hypothetical protein